MRKFIEYIYIYIYIQMQQERGFYLLEPLTRGSGVKDI